MATNVTLRTRLADGPTPLVEGDVLTEEHADYESARLLWNGMIDKRPAAIVRCLGPEEVAVTVRFAAEHDLPLSVRGGGHNVAGTALVDDGIVIDLSHMRGRPRRRRRPGPSTSRAVQPGRTSTASRRRSGSRRQEASWSETGVAGLALSGGVSRQRRRDGMTVDNLVSAQVVLADGRHRPGERRRALRPATGPCGAAAATSASSRPSSSASTTSGPRCSP